MLATTLTLAINAQAQGPNGSGTYYSGADGEKGTALKSALHNIIKNPDVVSYSGLIEAYKLTDTRPDGYVRDWYSKVTNYRHGVDTGSYKKEGDSYNREHSVPQSWFNEASPMKSDIVQVVPTDGDVNNRRSNYPLAEVGSVEWTSANGYCKLGSCRTAGYSGKVFEPNDEIKGDLARIYFYMATCYEDRATSWGHNVFSNDRSKGLEDWCLAMMMRWSKADPVDVVEIARNNAVWQVQGNRNPYVDYPNLEDYVWGAKKDVAFDYDDYAGGSNGGGGEEIIVETPTISPNGGLYAAPIVVTITCATTGATIHYTTDGSEATASATRYEGAITLATTTTLKAIAVKDGICSAEASATFTIEEGIEVPPSLADEEEIALNSTFFNYGGNGTISQTMADDLTGTQAGITVIYSLADGANRYCNDEHIRLYQKNQLTIESDARTLAEIEFLIADGSSSKTLHATTGTVTGYTWTGAAQRVTFSVNDGSGHLRIAGVKVRLADGAAGIEELTDGRPMGQLWTLTGQRAKATRRGLYIGHGRKFIVR